jgi:hypothetical protein
MFLAKNSPVKDVPDEEFSAKNVQSDELSGEECS